MSTIRIQTPQNVSVEYTVASIGDRIIAYVIDTIALLAWSGFWMILLSTTLGKLSNGKLLLALAVVLVGLPYVFYHLVCEVFFNGQSLGKRARDLRVIRLDGTTPRLGDYLLRWVLRIIDTGIVALLAIVLNGRGQRLGDMAAGTTVISERQVMASPLTTPAPLPGYVVVFPQADQLADHDVALIRQLLHKGTEREDYLLINELANKVKTLTGIRTELPDDAFLRTILRDHAHLLAEQYGR